MAEYSVGQLEAMARTLRAGTALLSEIDDAAGMLTAYAERIKADDGALCSDGECPHRFIAHSHPPAQAAQVDESAALAHFTDYFVRNYPGPDTIIYDPKWHAPKIFRAAQYAIANAATTAPTAEPVAQGDPNIPTALDECQLQLIEATEERDHLRAVLAAQPRATPSDEESTTAKNAKRYVEFREHACTASWEEKGRVGIEFSNKLDGIEHPTHEQFDNAFDAALNPTKKQDELCDCDADKYNQLPHHADCAALATQPRAVPDDKSRLDLLQNEIVDTIYMDDGRIIDVRGLDVRKAIDEFAAAPSPGESA